MIEEYVDIVNEHDEVIGIAPRSHIRPYNINYIRAVIGFIKNKDGYLWIARRTATKKIFPSALDASVGGCVTSGESYEQAFIRELEEELNIHAHEVSYHLKGILTPARHGIFAFTYVYEILSEQEPLFNSNDILKVIG